MQIDTEVNRIGVQFNSVIKEYPVESQKESSQREKCEAFAALHAQEEAFIIPNPWDIGSAKLLQGVGFKALATTSAGLAYTLGRGDGEISLEEKLGHCEALAANTSIPINADFENGFADAPETVAKNVLRVAATGVAGCSIEDYSRDSHTLYDFNHAVERVQAAADAVAQLDVPFQLTARAENLLRGVDDIHDTINRLRAFEEAGAQVLYAPGVRSLEQLREVTSAITAPFNVLSVFFPGVSLQEFGEAGAQRISVGGGLNYAAINPVLLAAREMLEQGTFNWSAGMANGAEVQRLLNS